MTLSTLVKGLCVPFALLCATSAGAAEIEDTLKAIQQQIDALNQKGKYTINSGAVAMETWLLTATAIDSTAGKIHDAVQPKLIIRNDKGVVQGERRVLVATTSEALDFGQAAMMRLEMQALASRLEAACKCPVQIESAAAFPALAGAVAGLLKTETELTAVDQTVDAKLLAAAVADKFDNAVLPTAAVAGPGDGQEEPELITDFNQLVRLADRAQRKHDDLAKKDKPTDADKEQVKRLAGILERFNTFYTRVTSAGANGAVPLATAARLEEMLKDEAYVLRVNPEKAGGTVVKRTNLMTALGAESVFLTGGVVSSYQLTDPRTGKVIKAGVVTCRTALTTLKRVQGASWNSVNGRERQGPQAVCAP
jgi:hypothetical protein